MNYLKQVQELSTNQKQMGQLLTNNESQFKKRILFLPFVL